MVCTAWCKGNGDVKVGVMGKGDESISGLCALPKNGGHTVWDSLVFWYSQLVYCAQT